MKLAIVSWSRRGYPLKAGQIRRDKKELRSFLSSFAVVAPWSLLLVKIKALDWNPVMRTFTAIVERDFDTNLYVGYVPGFPGAHSQAETLDELHTNLQEVIEMLLEDTQVGFSAEFIGTQQIIVG
jgi:predicted RNase H-like HicB family nuclease